MTKSEAAESLVYGVEAEGFGYYFLDYGPDHDAIKLLGGDEAIKALKQFQEAGYFLQNLVSEAEELIED